MSTHPMMFPSEWSERMEYERAKAGYWPYDIEDLRHFCALRDLRIEELKADNAKLQELALGLKWCSENYGCENSCPLYDKSEQDHCREDRLLRELGMEVDG